MTSAETSVTYRSPLHKMTQTTPTCLWNDSASIDELTYAIEHGAVGATCNPVIAMSVLAGDTATWRLRTESLLRELPTATEDTIAWKLVEELSIRAARLLEPIFETHHGRNGRLSIQTDPRFFRNSDAITEQALAFSRLVLAEYLKRLDDAISLGEQAITACASSSKAVFCLADIMGRQY